MLATSIAVHPASAASRVSTGLAAESLPCGGSASMTIGCPPGVRASTRPWTGSTTA
jgi:hypothetical protein